MNEDPVDQYADMLREEGAANDAMLVEALQTRSLPQLLREAAAQYEVDRAAHEAEQAAESPRTPATSAQ